MTFRTNQLARSKLNSVSKVETEVPAKKVSCVQVQILCFFLVSRSVSVSSFLGSFIASSSFYVMKIVAKKNLKKNVKPIIKPCFA